MSYDLSGRSLTPLSELISQADFPLSEMLPVDQVASVFDRLYVAEHSVMVIDDNLMIDAHLAFPEEISFAIPGADAYSLVLGSAGPGWTALKMHLAVGPDFALVLSDLTIGLRFDPDVLRNPATGAGAELSTACTLTIDANGVRITDYGALTLEKSEVGGTAVLVEARDVTLVLDGDPLPHFLAGQQDFRGVAFKRLAVSVPSEYLQLAPGQTLDLEIEDGAVGTTGFTGKASFDTGNGSPVTGTFLGFDCRLRKVELDLFENALLAGALVLDLRLKPLEAGGAEKWVRLDVDFDQDGGFSASASAVQPLGASSKPGALVTVDFAGAVNLALSGLRVEKDVNAAGNVWSIYFSGDVQVDIPGASWPELGFDEIGINSKGDLLVPEGGGITFETPLVVEWYFVRLLIPKFRFGRPEGSNNLLQVKLSAVVDLIEGLPAGASVDGLTITWDPGSSAAPDVSFSGIGVEFSSPGVFSAGIEVGFTQAGGSVEFRGQGHLELSALDIELQIGVIVGYDAPQDFSYLYLFADAKLLPTGIPIGNSGLSIYGFQGLIAYNMALTLDTSLPEDERYYELFMRDPIGITDIDKWGKRKGQNALGIGVILGTADKGFAFNIKGLLAIPFPDLVILLQARANFLKLKPDMSTASEGSMDALMVFDSIQNTFTFDIIASWGIPNIVEIGGSARVFFDFDDPGAFYLRIGQDIDGKRVTANVIRWGEKWLFSAGFWFELNARGVVTGVLIEVGVRFEGGGFWIEAIGRARGEMKLFWEPPQWEGDLELSGRIGAGYRGLSIGIELGGAARARVMRPMDVRIEAHACLKALFWKACVGHTFKWEKIDPPILERPLREISAKPRDWTLLVEGMPAPGAGGIAGANDGVVSLREGVTIAGVQPHSFLTINFAKPMIDNTGLFSERVPLPNDGFLTVGENSGFAASYELRGVRLVRDPGGDDEVFDIWGVWALETPNYNTSLRLLSSERFAHDGSLTESFVEGTELDYCDDPVNQRVCLPLKELEPGYGLLAGEYRYHWDTSKSPYPYEDRRNSPFLELLAGDVFSVWLGGGEANVEFHTTNCPEREKPEKEKSDGERFGGGTPQVTGPLPEADRPVPAYQGDTGQWVMPVNDGAQCLVKICFDTGHGNPEYVLGKRRGGLRTNKEKWTVPDSAQLLIPGETYALSVELKTQLRHPDGSKSEQPGAQQTWTGTFTVAPPPLYCGALDDYIAATYPFADARPVYTGYDFAIRFVDDYVNYLYAAGQQKLLIRLFDGQGRPVIDQSGKPVLIPATQKGMPEKGLSQSYWERQYLINKEAGCIAEDLGDQSGETTLTLPASVLTLTPNSQYRATLVSDKDIEVPLHFWTFTTSLYESFTDLVTRAGEIRRPVPTSATITSVVFDSACRQLGIATVAFVAHRTLTPFVSLDRTQLVAVLFEAPEPLDPASRLGVTLDGAAVQVITNGDGTRLLLRRATGTWAAGDHVLTLNWSRGQPSDLAETLRAVNGALGDETVPIAFASGDP
ncbi:DUF6603 domain-containing protein [Mesorhizobium sp. A623]